MPVRVQSWDSKFALLPIFEMNLPEGALRERLTRRFAKATGTFDDFDLLAIVGRTQIGRIRYSALNETLDELVPFQSIDQILRSRRDGGLFNYLMEQFAIHSGLSGVQPKVMIRAKDDKLSNPKIRKSPTIQSATHIVKFWHEEEFPELAANEFFCLTAAVREQDSLYQNSTSPTMAEHSSSNASIALKTSTSDSRIFASSTRSAPPTSTKAGTRRASSGGCGNSSPQMSSANR